MMRPLPKFLYAIMLIAALWTPLLRGQGGTGGLTGQVSDPSGGAIPGATIQVINQDTLAKRDTTTDGEGRYSFPGLPPGRYQVIVEAAGFSRRSSEVIKLAAGQQVVFSPQITVNEVKESVNVNGGAPVTTVETDSASISTTLGSQEVTGYGLNGRNFSALLTLAPGVSNQTGQDEAKVGVAGSAKFSVNGGRVEYNTFEIDGSDVLNTSINASRGQGEPLMVYPSIDAIQDMKVLTADYSALYGKSASGSILVTTKSGTDKFHGGGYGFLRNEAFNARNYFDQPDPVPPGFQGRRVYRTPLYRRLDFGGTISGPLFIPHLYERSNSKTFFFYSEEVRREKTPVDYNQAVPTVAERSGDFSDVCPPLVPGGPLTLTATARAAYPDCPTNPSSYIGRHVAIDYTSQALLHSGLIPEPNAVSGCNSTSPSPLAHCYVGAISPATHWREELFRVDHDLTSQSRLSFRYVHDSWDTTTLAPLYGIVHNSFPTVENNVNGPGLNMALILAQTLPHGFSNLVSASYAVQHITLTPEPGPGVATLARPATLDNPSLTGGSPVGEQGCSLFTAPSGSGPPTLNECPMGYIFNNGFDVNKPGQGGNKLPGLDFQGTNGAYGGHGFAADTGYAPWNQANPSFTVRDDASRIFGKHTLQWGFWGTYVQQNELSAVSGANSGDQQGLLTFSNQQSIYTTGNAFADFLAGSGFLSSNDQNAITQGAIKSFTQDSGQLKYYNRYKSADLYLQDDFRVLPRLTVNLGLRASLFGAWYNPKNTAYNWRPEDFNQSTGSQIYIDPNLGNLVNKGTGSAVPLNRAGPYNLGSLDPAITNGIRQCGVKPVPNSCATNSIFHPSPRVGFSLDPFGDGKTAIRAGYGLFWEHGTGYEANTGSLIGSAPLVLSETQSNLQGQPSNVSTSPANNAYNLIGLSCQGGSTQCGGANIPKNGATFPLNVTSIPTKVIYSYTQQWSLGFEREVRKGLVAQGNYVATKGTHLSAVRDLNQLQPLSNGLNPFLAGQPITAGVCNSGANNGGFATQGLLSQGSYPGSPVIGPGDPGYTNLFIACSGNPGFVSTAAAIPVQLGVSPDTVRPYLGFSNIISVENIADSEYEAFQATLRETTGPLTLGLAYTFSHSLDDSSDRASANFANSLNIHSNHASSDIDQRNLLNINYIYDLPLMKLLDGFTGLVGSGADPDTYDSARAASTQPVASSSHALHAALDHWQVSGITTFASGTPFSVVNGGGSDGTGAADNAGVADGLGIGSYADVIGKARAGKPYVASGGNNIGPLLLNPGAFAAPRGLTFGNSGRNYLNNPSRINFNVSLFKHFKTVGEKVDIEFRAEAYNIFNHTQFRITDPANPGNTGNNVINCYGSQVESYSAAGSSCLNGNSFLHPVDAHDPRILQFGLKGSF